MGHFIAVIQHHPCKNKHQKIGKNRQTGFKFRKNLDNRINSNHGSLFYRYAGADESGIDNDDTDQLLTPGKGVVESIPENHIDEK